MAFLIHTKYFRTSFTEKYKIDMRGMTAFHLYGFRSISLHGTTEQTCWKVLMGLLPEITLYYVFFTSPSGVQGILFAYMVLTLFVIIFIL